MKPLIYSSSGRMMESNEMPTASCNRLIESIGLTEMINSALNTAYGKFSTLAIAAMASASWWVDKLPPIAQLGTMAGGTMMTLMTLYVGYQRAMKERAEARRADAERMKIEAETEEIRNHS